MKIRNGFVSNSSSSSFVVAFEHVPKTKSELKKMLFGDAKEYPSPYPKLSKVKSWPVEKITETVWRDMKDGPVDEARVIAEMSGGTLYGDGAPRLSYEVLFKLKGAEYDWAMEEYRAAREKYACELRDVFVEKCGKDVKYFVFSYADEDGEYFSALEHGELFKRLPYVQISHH